MCSRSDIRCVTIVLIHMFCSVAIPAEARRGLADIESSSTTSSLAYHTFVAVTCVVSADGSDAVRRANPGAGSQDSASTEPIDGGQGGTIELSSGVKVDTGDGHNGSLESSTSLGPGEYHYHHVANPNPLEITGGTGEGFPEIKVSGHVVIRCQTMFCATITADDWDGQPPHVEIYAGPPTMPPLALYGLPMPYAVQIPYPFRSHYVDCTFDAPDKSEPVRGGTCVFHTTQFGGISGSVNADGGNGVDGGGGGNGGSLRVYANLGSVTPSCRADGGNGANGADLSGIAGGDGGDGGTIVIRAAGDPDFPAVRDTQLREVAGAISAAGGSGGRGASGDPGQMGSFDDTDGQTAPEADGSGTEGTAGGRGGDGGRGGSVRLEADAISDWFLSLQGGRGGDGGHGGEGGGGAYGVSGAPGEDVLSGTGGSGQDGGSGGSGAKGAAGGRGGDGGAGGSCLCIAGSINPLPVPAVGGGTGGHGGAGGAGGDGRLGGVGGRGGAGGSGGDGGHGGPGGKGADGASGGEGGMGGVTGQIVRRLTTGDAGCTDGSVPDGGAGFVPLPGDMTTSDKDGDSGDGGAGGNAGKGGAGGSGGLSGTVRDSYGSAGLPGQGGQGGQGGNGGTGGAGLSGGDGGSGGYGGRGGPSWVMAGPGGNGGNGANGGDSRSEGIEPPNMEDWQNYGNEEGYQPGEGGAGGKAGDSGQIYDPSISPAEAGQAGDSGDPGSVVPVEAKSGTPKEIPTGLPCGDKPVVVFVPGIAGSVLMGTGDFGHEQLWPTISPWDVRRLSLDGSGAPDIQAVDILRDVSLFPSLPLNDVYQPLIDFFVADGFVEFDLEGHPERLTSEYMLGLDPKPTLFPFPYDWRLDNADSAKLLRRYIDQIRKLHPDQDVYIVAHSMGGLVARRCILDNPDGIGKLATLGTPFWGAPLAIYRMVEGEFFGSWVKDPLDWVNNDALSEVLRTMPGFQQLLPSQTYLDNSSRPVMSEDDWDMNGDSVTGDYSDTQYWDFVDALAYPHSPSTNNINFHTPAQDDWSSDSTEIWYYHISGNLATPDTTVQVVAESRIVLSDHLTTINGLGDGTVPLCSANRLAGLRAPDPRTVSRVFTGESGEVAHMSLPKNDDILTSVLDFFYGAMWADPPEDYPCDTRSLGY